MKVKIIRDYNDLELKRLVTVAKDKELTVSEVRGAVLIRAGVAVAIDEADNNTTENKPGPKKNTKKKKEA